MSIAMSEQLATLDANLEPDYATPKWSETRWNGCWNPDEGVGLYMHMGRCRGNLDLWWAQTVAYLPDGQLAVDRSFGRTYDDAFVRTGVFELEQTHGCWSAGYEGTPQITTLDALVAAPQGAGAPAVPVTWEVLAEPVTPVWDLYGAKGDDKQVFAGDTHIQQAYTTTGHLTVGDRRYSLDGVGYKDHSSGTRTWDGYGSHTFLLAVMPGWTLHAIMLLGPNGEPHGPMGAVFRDGEEIRITRFDLAALTRLPDTTSTHDVVVELATGEVLELRAEVLHEFPITVTDGGENLNGIDWDAALPTSVLQEAVARLTLPDGTTGHTFFERGARRQDLNSNDTRGNRHA